MNEQRSIHKTDPLLIKHEIERIKAEKRQIIKDREKRKLEYKKVQIMIKNQQIDSNLKEYKEILRKNQELMRNIDIIKHTDQFKKNIIHS